MYSIKNRYKYFKHTVHVMNMGHRAGAVATQLSHAQVKQISNLIYRKGRQIVDKMLRVYIYLKNS
jgi:hypothetical protein